jgi:Protein of unknown function (DUF3237)
LIELKPLFEMRAQVGDILDLQPGPAGHRRIVPIVGGRFEGERLSGTMHEPGADWQTIRPDGVFELEIRTLLRTHEGEYFEMRGQALRHGPPEVIARIARGESVDPRDYYFREVMRFYTSAPRIHWLNNIFAVATGRRERAEVIMNVFEIA